MCLNCLKKDLFVNIKVICVIMILCKVLSAVILNRVCIYNFCGGCFCKIQSIYYMAANFAFKSKFKVKLLGKKKDKVTGIQNPSYVLKISS